MLWISKRRLIAWPRKIAGDKGYRAEWIGTMFQTMGIQPVIPSNTNEDLNCRQGSFDSEVYFDRNINERLIGWLKESRRIYSLFEKIALNYAGMIKMAFMHR